MPLYCYCIQFNLILILTQISNVNHTRVGLKSKYFLGLENTKNGQNLASFVDSSMTPSAFSVHHPSPYNFGKRIPISECLRSQDLPTASSR